MIVDTNVYLSRWPFRRLYGDEPGQLVAKLRENNVSQAWTGSFDAILHEDLSAANARLAEDCRTHGDGLLLPFGSVNPALPDWREDFRRCHEEHKMRGIRLHPNYHGYTLDDPRFGELAALAARLGMVVQAVLSMEDERTQHPLVRVPEVDTGPLLRVVRKTPGLRLVILNRMREPSGKLLGRLSYTGEVYFDFARLEGVGGINRLLEAVPEDRVLFGSYFPFFYFESALGKVKEAGLTQSQEKAILGDNARLVLD
jgi:predicted TIM-barrel fold metal-dependent hydrolase